ncbi:MAG: hypothetical protein H7641_11190 [Candidatus Heimdallarchaeota archaeon]|nr:hypothetical protein [Candidatus Heimdallarchaeota archaeon]MCK4878126.1 hypothetical protein [Candidatus Heimdallarchaeota archaeon]
MKHRLMDLLACPLDKSWPLKLEILEEEMEKEEIPLPIENKFTNVICSFYCNFKKFILVNLLEDESEETKTKEEIERHVTLKDCKNCFQIEIQSGKLYCSEEKDKHIYEIKEGIPIMLSKDQIEELHGKKK